MWFFMGDIHGSVNDIKNFMARNKEDFNFENENHNIILLGDVGCNYFREDPKYQGGKADRNFKRKLSKLPFTFYLVRGNHEERPSNCFVEDEWEVQYDENVGGNVYVELAFPRIKYFMDVPTLYTIEGYTTLVMGGAYSVDKMYRIMTGNKWYEGEQLTPEEMDIARKIVAEANNCIDIILTHTCPISFEPSDLFLSFIDQNTVDKTMERFFGELEYKMSYRAWLWGHFHKFRDYPRDDGKIRIMLNGTEALELEEMLNQVYPIVR